MRTIEEFEKDAGPELAHLVDIAKRAKHLLYVAARRSSFGLLAFQRQFLADAYERGNKLVVRRSDMSNSDLSGLRVGLMVRDEWVLKKTERPAAERFSSRSPYCGYTAKPSIIALAMHIANHWRPRGQSHE